MKLIELDQRTQSWHAWRARIIGGSDAPVIMGVSKWSTPHKLWGQKTGRVPPTPDNPAMARGREMEGEALQAWSRYVGEVASPACVEHETLDFVGASLDGMTFDGSLIVEIKCPGERAHRETLESRAVPAYYWPQVQHQLACVPEAEVLHYWSYRPGMEPVLVEVRRDQSYIDTLLEKEAVFWECVKNDVPPAGNRFLEAEQVYLRVLQEAEEVERRLKEAKADLIAAIPEGESKAQGMGVVASLVEKKGSVDYKTALLTVLEELEAERPSLPAGIQAIMDGLWSGSYLEGFRKTGTSYWDVRPVTVGGRKKDA
jgi:putative phage-type endonuclease